MAMQVKCRESVHSAGDLLGRGQVCRPRTVTLADGSPWLATVKEGAIKRQSDASTD